MTEKIYQTPKEQIETQIKELRFRKITLYNLRDKLQEQLKISRKNNQGVGGLLLKIEDINIQLKIITERLNRLYSKSLIFNY